MGILERARKLLPDANESLLAFTVDLVEDNIKNYCNVKEVPEGLHNVAASMVLDAWRQSQFGKEALEPEAKGVTRRDASFSFVTPSEIMQATISNPGFTQDYITQLNAYRKMRR